MGKTNISYGTLALFIAVNCAPACVAAPQTARLDARNYAVTARGFNSPFANKLLILIDGRSVYTPLFSSVFWDAQAGFRTDWDNHGAGFTFQGDAYNGSLHLQETTDSRIAGANQLGRVNQNLADRSNLRLQAYLDHTQRDQPRAFNEHLTTLDLEFQHALRLAQSHHPVWGGGYRYAWDRVQNGTAFAFLPDSSDMRWGNAFLQGEVELGTNLRLTMGMKLEHNNYTGLESLPSLRLPWRSATNHLMWSSALRAVRAPSRIGRDFFSPASPAVVDGVPRFAIAGGPDFVS